MRHDRVALSAFRNVRNVHLMMERLSDTNNINLPHENVTYHTNLPHKNAPYHTNLPHENVLNYTNLPHKNAQTFGNMLNYT